VSSAGSSTARRQWRLGRQARRTVLVVHLVSVGAWIGMDVVLALLVFTAFLTDDPYTAGLSYQALGLFAVWPLFGAGLVCLASGVVLGLGTGYGLVRYWWVAVKLVLNVLLSTLVLIALRPTIDLAVVQGRELMDGERLAATLGDLIYPPIVSPLALLIAMLLAVFKPWGRIRAAAPDAARPPVGR
jgi:hypothetical protein